MHKRLTGPFFLHKPKFSEKNNYRTNKKWKKFPHSNFAYSTTHTDNTTTTSLHP